MSFLRYGAYKESGVKWLGEVPEHWNVNRNKHIFHIVNEAVGERSTDFQLLSLTLRGVIPRDINSGKGKFPAEFDTYQIVKPGDIVFCLFDIDETPRTVGIASKLGMITGAYTVTTVLSCADPRFIYYYYFNIDLRKGLRPFYTGLRKVVRPETFMNIEMPLPPKLEQTQISNFLDHETDRIDTLIAEQQQLIALLKEKRQAVISHTVTKGLDPTALMKDSGVEWLGEVPTHWEVARVKHVIQGFAQGWSPQCDNVPIENDKECGVLKVGCVNGGIFSAQENKRLPENLNPIPELFLKSGDVLISRANTRELVGSAALVESDQPNLMLSDKLFRLRTTEDILPKHLVLYLGTSNVRHQIELEATGASSSMLNIGQAIIKELSIPVPPISEQLEITTKLEISLGELYRLQKEAQLTQDLLQERRSALISAAVTGKIDVRGWQAPANAPPAPILEPAHG